MSHTLDTSMIHVRRGDIVLDTYTGKPVMVLDFYLAPNSPHDPTLVCIIVGRLNNGDKVSATSNNFSALPDELYEVRFPSEMDRPMETKLKIK